MSASTEGSLFYGAMSDDFDAWQSMEEEHGREATKQRLRFGRLADGETTGFYLAVRASMTEVNAGEAKALTATKFIPPWQWKEKIEVFAGKVGVPLQSGEPTWYVVCKTDRDY
jgi:hypothetical protein